MAVKSEDSEHKPLYKQMGYRTKWILVLDIAFLLLLFFIASRIISCKDTCLMFFNVSCRSCGLITNTSTWNITLHNVTGAIEIQNLSGFCREVLNLTS